MHFHREDRDNEGEEEGRIKTKSKAAGAPPGASSAALASAAPPPTVLDVGEDAETKDARSRSPRGVAPTVRDVEENTETKDARSRSPRMVETAPADPVLAGWRGVKVRTSA